VPIPCRDLVLMWLARRALRAICSDVGTIDHPDDRTGAAGATGASTPAHHAPIHRARRLARWLDRYYVDPIVGLLVPGVGDLMTGAAGLYLVVLAFRARMPWIVIARMLINLTVDIVVGLIPILGDVFDFVWRANERNLKLLEKRAAAPRPRATFADWAYVLGAALLFVAALAFPIVLVVWALRRAFA
jgi:hypothetical protein